MSSIQQFEMQQFSLEGIPSLPDFMPVLEIYFVKRGVKLMPSWPDFEFQDFVGWHSRLALSKREESGFRFRIFGDDLVEIFASNLTGELLYDSVAPGQMEITRRYFEKLTNGPSIGLRTGRVPVQGRGFLNFQVLHLPLSATGTDVDHFIHVLKPG